LSTFFCLFAGSTITYKIVHLVFFADHGGRRLNAPTASVGGKNNGTDAFITPRVILHVLGSVQFYLGHKQLVPPQCSYFCNKNYNISHCPSLPLTLAVLFVSSLAVTIFPSLCMIVVSLGLAPSAPTIIGLANKHLRLTPALANLI
jgi:hypothetical protein